MKALVVVVLLLALVFVLDPFDFNLSPEKLLEILSQSIAELIKFLTKFLEGLA